MTNETIQITKKNLFIIIFVIFIIVIILFYFLNYIPNKNKKDQINLYKKAVYESISCQYNCPINDTKIANKTQRLPDFLCLQRCIMNIREKNLSLNQLSQEDLLNDDFAKDITDTIDSCKEIYAKSQITNGSLSNSTLEIPQVDADKLFECVRKGLINIKNKYSYL